MPSSPKLKFLDTNNDFAVQYKYPAAVMFNYHLPKSSIWGHSLRKMEPARQKALFGGFLAKAVAEYSSSNGSLTVLGAALRNDGNVSRQLQHFTLLLGSSPHGAFWPLNGEQAERCVNEIIRDETLRPGVMLLQGFQVTKWSINGRPAATDSMFNLYYSFKPCVSTFLKFETMEHFQYVKQVLQDLKFCTLSEKHLKPSRRAKA
jgi:hypothetical protein